MSLRKQSHETHHRVDLCPNRSIMSPALVREKEDGLRGMERGKQDRDREIQRETMASSLTDVKLLLASH